jgi:hypothetical protein
MPPASAGAAQHAAAGDASSSCHQGPAQQHCLHLKVTCVSFSYKSSVLLRQPPLVLRPCPVTFAGPGSSGPAAAEVPKLLPQLIAAHKALQVRATLQRCPPLISSTHIACGPAAGPSSQQDCPPPTRRSMCSPLLQLYNCNTIVKGGHVHSQTCNNPRHPTFTT